jgi:hypothetical protein
MSIIPFNNFIDPSNSSDGELFFMKTNHIKAQPPLKMNKVKSAYFYNCSHKDMSTIWSLLFKNLEISRNNIKFEHSHILNSLNYFNLIVINDFYTCNEITEKSIQDFLDVISKKGELVIFCNTETKYNYMADLIDSMKIKFNDRNIAKNNIFLRVLTIVV